MVMTLRRHNPPHLGPAIVWYLWLMISTNRFVIFLWDEYEWRAAWEEGCDLFCFHFVLGSNRRSVSDRDASALCLGGRLFSDGRTDSHTSVFHINPIWSFSSARVILVCQRYWWLCVIHNVQLISLVLHFFFSKYFTSLLYGSSFPPKWPKNEFVVHCKNKFQYFVVLPQNNEIEP